MSAIMVLLTRDGRLTEWGGALAALLLGWGLAHGWLALAPPAGVFTPAVKGVLGWLLLILGHAWAAALYVNGRHHRTPHVRAACCAVALLSFSALGWHELSPLVRGAPVSSGAPLLIAASLTAVVALYRTCRDARPAVR